MPNKLDEKTRDMPSMQNRYLLYLTMIIIISNQRNVGFIYKYSFSKIIIIYIVNTCQNFQNLKLNTIKNIYQILVINKNICKKYIKINQSLSKFKIC